MYITVIFLNFIIKFYPSLSTKGFHLPATGKTGVNYRSLDMFVFRVLYFFSRTVQCSVILVLQYWNSPHPSPFNRVMAFCSVWSLLGKNGLLHLYDTKDTLLCHGCAVFMSHKINKLIKQSVKKNMLQPVFCGLQGVWSTKLVMRL